jgi:hypothetical protein
MKTNRTEVAHIFHLLYGSWFQPVELEIFIGCQDGHHYYIHQQY